MANYSSNKPYAVGWNGVRDKYEIVPDYSNPLPPRNVFVTNPYVVGALDIRWDSPLDSPENSKWKIEGVNIYRSEDSEAGPFEKINSDPIETLFLRDQTINKLIVDEDVKSSLHKGSNPVAEWAFTTRNTPIVKQNSQNILADTSADVLVKIDNGDGKGLVPVPAFSVNGRTGEIFLITNPVYNPETKKIEDPRLPSTPDSKITCTYWHNTNHVRSDLVPRFFYKVTTVGRDAVGNVFETSLDKVVPANVFQIEKPHYIWKGIIAKNRYLLEQFGERVKLFMRKEMGKQCPNYSDTHKQATDSSTCTICYGTGIVGGYQGPFDIVIAPPEAEKHIDLTDIGLKLNFTFESWTGPSPMLRSRDFIVRQTGERLMIGSVTPQGAKGSIFQQHFMLNYRDSKDIIYSVPVYKSHCSGDSRISQNTVIPVSDDTRGINNPVTPDSPVIPEHKSERANTDKGRTIDYENVTW